MNNQQSDNSMKSKFSSVFWSQRPLSKKELSALEYDECRKMSIRTKILLVLAIALSIFGITSAFISYHIYMDMAVEQHKRMASGISTLAVGSLNPDKIESYLEAGTVSEHYTRMERRLRRIKDMWDPIEFVYMYRISEDSCTVIFDIDTDREKGKEPGEKIPLDPSIKPYLPTLISGGTIPPIITDDNYGWLLTVYTPVYDSKGICQGYVGIDISMDKIRIQARDFTVKLLLIFFLLFVIILLATFWLAKYNLILPINTMAHSAGIFAYHNDEALEQSLERISKLNIHTGDEVENLYRSFVKMTRDSVRYMTDIRNKNETIAKMQTALILTLADMVERRDKNTGRLHLGNGLILVPDIRHIADTVPGHLHKRTVRVFHLVSRVNI